MTGTPPYGNLPAAASLYRIVQDDHPPLPEGITPVRRPCQMIISSLMTHSHRPCPSKCAQALHELLLLCFQKDVDRRITADKLLKHPWIGAAKHRQHTTALSDVSTHHEVVVIFVLHLTWLARCTGGKQDRRTSHEARHGDSDSIDQTALAQAERGARGQCR